MRDFEAQKEMLYKGLILKIEVIGELLNLEIVFLVNLKINLKFY